MYEPTFPCPSLNSPLLAEYVNGPAKFSGVVFKAIAAEVFAGRGFCGSVMVSNFWHPPFVAFIFWVELVSVVLPL